MNHTQTKGGLCSSSTGRLSRWLFALASTAAIIGATSAEASTVTGRVLNKGTGDYLKFAQVQVVGTEQATLTEADGTYRLTNVAPGEIKVRVVYTGLDPQEVSVTVPAEGTVTADVSMSSGDYGDLITLGEFKVTSAREGNAKAIVEQRHALNMKTVISADAFGDVSEGNVGEFLRLLPGVTVDYVDNDVRTVRIRGLPGKYALTTMDGHAIATAGSADINTGRQFELEQVSLTSLDTVETAKSPTPDMSTPGLAGNTNILSKSAFNQQGRSIKYSAAIAMNQNDLTFKKTNGPADKDTYKLFPVANIEWIDKLLDGKLGIVLSAGHSSAYNVQNAFIGSYTFDRNPYNNRIETPLLTSINLQNGPKTTDRDSLLFNVEYQATDDLRLALRTSYGNYNAPFHNRNWTINSSTQAMLTSTATTTAWPGSGEFAGNFRTGVYSGATGGNHVASGNSTYAALTGSNLRKAGGTFVISPAVMWKVGDFKVDAGASYSRSKSFYRAGSEGFFSQVEARMNGIGWQWSKTGDDVDYLIKQTTGAGSMLNVANYTSNGAVLNEIRDGNDQVWTANLDGTWDRPDWTIPTTFKAGVNSTLKVLDIERWTRRWDMALSNATGSTATTINLADFSDPYNTINGNGVVLEDMFGNRGPMPSTDKWKLWEHFQTYGNEDAFSQTAAGPFRAQANANLRNKLQNMWDIEEKIQAAYVMGTVKPVKKLTLVAGLRFERTETAGRSFDDKGLASSLAAVGVTMTNYLAMNTTARATITGTGSSANNDQAMNYVYYRYGSRKTREQSYDTVLPSVQGKYNISKNLLVRAAYYKSLLRPDFQHAVGGITVSDPSDTAPDTYTFTIRNSDLEPETANNFDASIEYYMEPVGLISLAGFYKDVKDIQVNFTQTIDLNNLPEAVAGLGLSNIHPDSRISTYVNGPKTSVSGLELAYQQELTFLPGAFKGLGVTANYTYIRPEDKRLWALVANAGDGLSQHAFNFVLRYKYQKFNAQVTTTWADQKIRAINNLTLNSTGELTPGTGVNSNVQEIIRDRVQINMSFNYQLHRRATLFFNVSNIVNEPQYRYQEQETYITRHGNYGAGYTLGVKGTF